VRCKSHTPFLLVLFRRRPSDCCAHAQLFGLSFRKGGGGYRPVVWIHATLRKGWEESQQSKACGALVVLTAGGPRTAALMRSSQSMRRLSERLVVTGCLRFQSLTLKAAEKNRRSPRACGASGGTSGCQSARYQAVRSATAERLLLDASPPEALDCWDSYSQPLRGASIIGAIGRYRVSTFPITNLESCGKEPQQSEGLRRKSFEFGGDLI